MLLAKFLNSIIKEDGFILKTSDEKTFIIGNPNKKNPAVLKLKNKIIEYKLIVYPDLYFGEGYLNEEIIIENGDISEILNISLKNIGRGSVSTLSKTINKIRGTWRYLTNFYSRQRAKESIESHYDLGNAEFYKNFLDNKHFKYSCGLHPKPNTSLEDSQEIMINHIIKKLKITSNDNVLEVGSGFGGICAAIAKKTGARVKGITLSKVQFDHSKNLVREKKIDNLCDFELKDFRDLQGKFSKILSFGQFEHTIRKHYNKYFKKIYNLLSKDGIALVHTIGSIDKPRDPQPWISKRIFPFGYTCSFSEVMPAIENSRLILSDLEILPGIHYASTLKEWKKRFINNKDKIIKKYGKKLFLTFEFYLSACQYAFLWQDQVNFQILLRKDINTEDRTRSYIYN